MTHYRPMIELLIQYDTDCCRCSSAEYVRLVTDSVKWRQVTGIID